MAMVNGVGLAQALDRYEIDTALAVWEHTERSVTTRVQRYSRVYGKIGTRWPRRMLELRSALIWAMAKARSVQRRIQFAAGYFPALDTGTRINMVLAEAQR